MNEMETEILIQLDRLSIDELKNLKVSIQERDNFVDKLITYYKLHLSGFSKLKSYEILKELFQY